MPAPAVTGAILLCSAVSWPRSASMVGQICTHTWFMSSLEPLAPRLARTRRIASRQLAMARSTCGRPDDLAGLVAHDDDLAHLGEGDETVVVGVVLGDALVEQDVLGRLEPRHVEGREAPEVEAAPDHGVHAADEPVLDERAVDRAEGEVADRAPAAGADGDGDPAYVLREGQLLEQRGQLRRSRRRATRAPRASAGRGRRRTGARSGRDHTSLDTAASRGLPGTSSSTPPIVDVRCVGRSSSV